MSNFVFLFRNRSNARSLARSFKTSNSLTASLSPSRPPQLSSPTAPHGVFPNSTLQRLLQFVRTDPRMATHRDAMRSRGSGSSWRRPPRRDWLESLNSNVIIWGIIGINVGVFLLWQLGSVTNQVSRDPTLLRLMMNNFRVNMPNITSGRIWTLITACFSHMDPGHLFINCLSFYFVAPAVIPLLGNKRFLALYLMGGICSSLTSVVWHHFYKRDNSSALGSSGAVLSTLALYTCAFPQSRIWIFFVIPCPAWAFLPGILCFDIYQNSANKRTNTETDIAGHVGGMLYGIGYFIRAFTLRR